MKVRRQGDSLVIPVPEKFGIKEGDEFVSFKGRRGGIIYIPKQEDIFEKALEEGRSLRYEEEFGEDISVGREEI